MTAQSIATAESHANATLSGWNLRVALTNATKAQIRPYKGSGSRVLNDLHEDSFNACNCKFLEAISLSIRNSENPVYPVAV